MFETDMELDWTVSAVPVSTTELASGLNLGFGHLEQERSVNTGRKNSRKNCRIGMTWERQRQQK